MSHQKIIVKMRHFYTSWLQCIKTPDRWMFPEKLKLQIKYTVHLFWVWGENEILSSFLLKNSLAVMLGLFSFANYIFAVFKMFAWLSWNLTHVISNVDLVSMLGWEWELSQGCLNIMIKTSMCAAKSATFAESRK